MLGLHFLTSNGSFDLSAAFISTTVVFPRPTTHIAAPSKPQFCSACSMNRRNRSSLLTDDSGTGNWRTAWNVSTERL
jgi:hypothetical protein